MHQWPIELLFLLIIPLCSTQTTYYIIPSPDTTCPGQPCRTLPEYLAEESPFLTSDLTLRFLPGNYTLESNVSVEYTSSLSLIGDFSNFPLISVRIICSESVSLSFSDIGDLYITGLEFISCGGDYRSALRVENVLLVLISNSIFQNCHNLNQNGGALSVYLGDRVILSGNRFENNSAFFGGGVYIMGSTVDCTGNIFVGNTAEIDGGGLYFEFSDGNITENTYTNNRAGNSGGGCDVESSRVTFSGNRFQNNQAGKNGGGTQLLYSTVACVENGFTDNTANNTGGGLFMDGSTTELSKNNFTGNSANFNAGGVLVGSSSEVNFTENRFISNGGGGWVVYVQFGSPANFVQNVIANNSGNVIYGSSVQNSSINYVTNASDVPCPGEPCRTLSEYLEQPTQYFASDVTFVFLPGNHTIQNSLLVADIASLSLLGSSTFPQQITNIVCDSASSFAFIRITELHINGLGILSCADGNNPAISIFSVILCRISNCTFTNNVNLQQSAAGVRGGAIYAESSNLTVTGSMFQNNSALTGGGAYITHCIANFVDNTFLNNFGSFGGAGVYMVQSTVDIIETSFISNLVVNEGGALEMFFSRVTFAMDTVFRSNLATSFGGGIVVGNSDLQFKGRVSFVMNSARLIGGAFLAFGTNMTFNAEVSFEDNVAQYGGALMAAGESSIEFTDVTLFQNNSAIYGGGIYITESSICFTGLTTIDKSTANYGGGVYASSSNLQFNGTINFEANTAVNGGGLLLTTDSKFYLFPNTVVSFTENTARATGGAIEVVDSVPLIYCFGPTDSTSFDILDECFFQIQTNSTSSVASFQSIAELNTRIYFDANYAAEGGSDLYGGTIDNCRFPNIIYCQEVTCDIKSSGDVFDFISSTVIPNESVDISSQPLNTCSCTANETKCSNSTIIRRVHPGGSMRVAVIALGQRNGSVPAVIRTTSFNNIAFRDLEYTQTINQTCSHLQFTILTSVEEINETVEVYAQGPCSRGGRSLPIQIEVLPCPRGFQLSATEQACVCDQRLKRFTNTCDIDSATILRPRNDNFWVGYDNDSQGLILRNQCPFDYCTSDDAYILVGDSSLLCNFNRSGILCGECVPGFSAVFGSSHCLQCTDDYLSLLLVFAFAGIALVFLLFILRLTVAAGTIHGLIFYANVVQANSALFFPSGISNVFIAWLNLDVGVETCFYEGMDMYAKTWLQFVFPAYVWSLVGIIILISHFSRKVAALLGNNPVAVLATLFLLSYAKFLHTIIAGLSIAYVEYPNGLNVAVWVNDGNIRYLRGKHIPLFIAAMSSVIFLFLPYTLLLTFSQWIQAKSEWKIFSWITRPAVKALLDAYHAPYSAKQRYWTGLLLIFRCVVFFAYGGDGRISLLAISSTSFVIMAFLTTGIYKNRLLTLLETSFILNLGVLAAATSYIHLAGGNQDAVTYTSIAVAVVFFIGIVTYHAAVQIRDTTVWKKVKENLDIRVLHKFSKSKSYKDFQEEDSTDIQNTVISVNVTSTFVELREPLLEDN